MSPILDLENLTPISLEDIGEPKQENMSTTKNEVHVDVFSVEEIKKEPKNKLIIKKKKKEKIIKNSFKSTTNDLLLSIKDCETLSGISKVSIRKSIKEKEINYILEDGKYKISFKELLKWCYASTRRRNVFNNQGIGKYVNEWNILLQ